MTDTLLARAARRARSAARGAGDRLGLFLQLDRPVEAAEVDAARDLLVRRGFLDPDAPDYEAIVHGLRLPDERQA